MPRSLLLFWKTKGLKWVKWNGKEGTFSMGISMDELSLHQLLVQYNECVLCNQKFKPWYQKETIRPQINIAHCWGLGSKRDASGTLGLRWAVRIPWLGAERDPASIDGIWARAPSCTEPGSPSPLPSSCSSPPPPQFFCSPPREWFGLFSWQCWDLQAHVTWTIHGV